MKIHESHESDVFDSIQRTKDKVEVRYYWVAHQCITYEFKVISGDTYVGWLMDKLGLIDNRLLIQFVAASVKYPDKTDEVITGNSSKEEIRKIWSSGLYSELSQYYRVEDDPSLYKIITEW